MFRYEASKAISLCQYNLTFWQGHKTKGGKNFDEKTDWYVKEDELHLSLVNFEHGGQVSQPRILEVEDSGDFEGIAKELIEQFMY